MKNRAAKIWDGSRKGLISRMKHINPENYLRRKHAHSMGTPKKAININKEDFIDNNPSAVASANVNNINY